MKANKSISQKKFLIKINFFAISKMAKNQFFELGKSFKTAKNAISQRKKIDLLSRR